MLFNSYGFILIFAPLALGGFFLLGWSRRNMAIGWLALASLVFYGWWDPRLLPLLLASVAFNYAMGLQIHRFGQPGDRRRARLLALAICVDLAVLVYFKYAGFFLGNVKELTGWEFAVPAIVLPLGISFFTFTQIAYLVDVARGAACERNPLLYLLFVTYFPHLIAGPIIHHKDVMPRFGRTETFEVQSGNMVLGLVIFIVGLFKKVVLADSVAAFAGPVFKAAEQGAAPDFLQAWGGALSYTFQLYFDFSGYSDMAIGISLLLNVPLPLNFNSPYKSTSIIEFWKRWHISLSTFLRDYLYIPLGGNRLGSFRRYGNLLATMLIGGLWHGAAWTFIVWGGLHGCYLVINHGWRALRGRMTARPAGSVERAAGWAVTFLAVVAAWVFFRAATFHGAAAMLRGMTGGNGVAAPQGEPGRIVLTWGWCVVCGAVAFLVPNTQQFAARIFGCRAADPRLICEAGRTVEIPAFAWAVGLGAMAALAIVNLMQPAEFLYFNF